MAEKACTFEVSKQRCELFFVFIMLPNAVFVINHGETNPYLE